MEGAMKPSTSEVNSCSRSNEVSKIRIIHVIAPQIIKTDKANFRELVQSLTGKRSASKCTGTNKRRKKKARSSSIHVTDSDFSGSSNECRRSIGSDERIKEEEETWGGGNSSFLSGFGDLGGFMQGMTEFPVTSSRMDAFGGEALLL